MHDTFDRPSIAGAALSVVLPAYNDEATLEAVIGDWLACLEGLNREYELILVDDASTDRTAERAEALAAGNSRLRLLRHPAQRGFGACLRIGLQTSHHPLFCYSDCTGSYHPADLGRFLELVDRVDVVAGYRVSPNSDRLASRDSLAHRWLRRLVFGVRLLDPHCCFKLFRRCIFARIPIQSNGLFVHTEILAKANFLSCLMTEVPVSYGASHGVGKHHQSPSTTWHEALRIFRQPDFGPPVTVQEAVLSSADSDRISGSCSAGGNATTEGPGRQAAHFS